jgi:mono/diheme cytochrome c family protein
MIKGVGGAVGPDLTNIGGKGIAFYDNILHNPPGIMPNFGKTLPQTDLTNIATFLDGLGTKYK